jgi:hypothetical protein
MKMISLIIIICLGYIGNWQSENNQIKLLTNEGEKYWDISKGDSWRLDKRGLLSEYYYENKVRVETNNHDIVISHHRWSVKDDVIFEMADARVIGEYQVLKLTKDTMILKSKFGMNGTDTLIFQSSKDQVTRIKRTGKSIKLVY